ncbi:ECF transporter S component [Streptococcus pantholopis]|uniref:Riboflavin transporter n=1 Tax=Streptococcus pantholopis TaxID=1811193 RepID=A0A172Q9E4_9STRE|nr:ECF transporter S component [Streptococcus pantholopis]AND80084.1 hypothetical protein A0O21_08760 [Streptococcus pantholopis]
MTKTRQMAYIAILSALSFLLMYIQFPLIPSAGFLQVDFSILPVLLGLVIFDLSSAYAILIIRTLLKLLLNNGGVSTLIGLPMNFVALGLFVLALALLWNKKRTVKNYIVGSVVGTLGLTGAMFILNYIYAVPLYARFAHFDIDALLGLGNYLFAMVIPFNLLEGLIFAVTFLLLYTCLEPVLKKL